MGKDGIAFCDLNNHNRLSYYDFRSKQAIPICKQAIAGYDLENNKLYFNDKSGNYYMHDISTGQNYFLTTAISSPIIKKIKGSKDIYIALDGENGTIGIKRVSYNEAKRI